MALTDIQRRRRFARRLRHLRRAKKLSQTELARRSNICQSQLSRYELGLVYPHMDIISRLAKALDEPTESLVPDVEPRRRGRPSKGKAS